MIPTPLTLVALAALTAGAIAALWQGAAWPFVIGPGLAAGAPLVFVAVRLRTQRALDHHPITVSVLSGLGCVIAMVGSLRFGDQHAWTLYTALASLIIWMLWQRDQRRHPPSP